MNTNVYPLLAWAAVAVVLDIAGRLTHRPFLRAAALAQAFGAIAIFAIVGLILVVAL